MQIAGLALSALVALVALVAVVAVVRYAIWLSTLPATDQIPKWRLRKSRLLRNLTLEMLYQATICKLFLYISNGQINSDIQFDLFEYFINISAVTRLHP